MRHSSTLAFQDIQFQVENDTVSAFGPIWTVPNHKTWQWLIPNGEPTRESKRPVCPKGSKNRLDAGTKGNPVGRP